METIQNKFLRAMAPLLLAAVWLAPSLALAGPWGYWNEYQGRKAYEAKQFAQAQEDFVKALESKATPQDFYNLGVTQYRLKDYPKAEQNFMAALNSSEPGLQEQAYYNLGNEIGRASCRERW